MATEHDEVGVCVGELDQKIAEIVWKIDHSPNPRRKRYGVVDRE